MFIEFNYDSESLSDGQECARLEISFELHAWNEADYNVDNIYILNKETGHEVLFDTLPQKEQNEIDNKINDLAYENSYEAYQDSMIMQADALYDQWKDSQYE